MIPRRDPRSLTPAAPSAPVVSIRTLWSGWSAPQSQQWPSGATVPSQATHTGVWVMFGILAERSPEQEGTAGRVRPGRGSAGCSDRCGRVRSVIVTPWPTT
ncbi:hypothetical protein GCM10009603_17060 [Nocardiopsis exhalans]